jgi:hypothetical protein
MACGWPPIPLPSLSASGRGPLYVTLHASIEYVEDMLSCVVVTKSLTGQTLQAARPVATQVQVLCIACWTGGNLPHRHVLCRNTACMHAAASARTPPCLPHTHTGFEPALSIL